MSRGKGKNGDSSPNDRTLPEWMDAAGDHGPLTVLLMSPARREGKLPNNPFVIARSMKEQVGAVSAAYRDKDGNLVVKVRSERKASKLLELNKLIDGTEVKVEEHARLNQTRCIVTCYSVSELSEEELAKELADQGVIQVHRLGRKDGKSATMIVTFRGTVVPKEIFFGYDRCATREYKQAPMQCFRCFDYGHTKARCTAKEICRNCSKAHQINKDQDGKTVCESAAKCKHCGGAHSPTSRMCPKYTEEEAINEIRTKEDKSVREARRLFEERKSTASGSSYASVAGNSNSDHRTTEAMKKQIETTQNLLKKALDEIASLKKTETEGKERARKAEQELLKARRKIDKLRAKSDKKNGKAAIVPTSESEHEMDVTEPENPKRLRSDDSEDSNNEEEEDDDEHEEEEDDDEQEEEEDDDEDEEDDGNNKNSQMIQPAKTEDKRTKAKPTVEVSSKPKNQTNNNNNSNNNNNPKNNNNSKKVKTNPGQSDSAPKPKPKPKRK